MKLLAAFGLLAIAFAAWQPTERSFQSGNTYEFEWKGQIVSGIPVKGASSHSLQQIRSKIHLTVADKHSYIRLSDVRISNGHKQLTEPRYYSEGSSLEESQLSTEQREQLTYPVRFRYHKGIVSEIVFSEEESAWSENIKRAVLNMLQVQMTGTKSQDEYNKEKYDVETKNKFFIVPTERMLEGECEVAYTIVDSGRDEKEVTKSINFDKCSKRVDIRYGPRYSNECPMCDTADSRPESQTVMTYKIRGEEESFLISEVELKSEYIFTPLAKDKEMLATYVHQKMRLVKISSAERVSEPRNGKKSSLLYNYERELAREKFWMNGDESEYKLTGYEGIPKKELMDKYVRLAVKSMEETTVDGVTLDTNHNFARMVEIFRMCTERDIQEIHRHFWDAESFGTDVLPKVRHLLSDALIAAGTKNTIQHFIEKVEKNQMCPIRASLAIKGLTNIRIPSEKIISQLIALSKSRVCREQPILRQSVLLTVGALMNGLCNKNTPEQWAVQLKDQKECTRELKKEWMNEWEKLFSEGETRYEKVLVLKAVANSAIDVSIHFLEKVIYDRREPLVVRQAAVDALRMLRDQMPRKVQSVCLPLFKSRREPVPLRISALYQLVHSRPERALLDQIVHHLNYEPSVQLRSFGVSLLRSLAESKKNPCEEKLAEDIAVSLRMLRGAPLSVSTHVHLPWYSRALDLGYTMDFASIFSNNSFLPNELLASVDSLYAGQWYKHFLQVGVFQNNMDNILIPLMEKLEKSESEIRVRGQRSQMAPLRETLKDMLRQMKIQARDNGYKSEESFGMLYIRHKNLDYAVVPMEQEILDKMIKDFSSYTTSEIVRQLTRGVRFEGVLSGFVYEYVRIVPTTFGLPLQVTNKMPTVGSVNGLIKVELGSKIALRVEMEPSFVSTHVHEMIVLAPEMHHGARVFHSAQVTLPINCNMEYSYEKNSIKANIRLPKEEKRVFLFESRPTTYVRTFSSKRSPVLDEKTVRIPSFEKTSVHYEQTYGEELFGLPIEVVGSVHRRFFEKPEVFLYGENHVQAILKPNGRNSLEAVEITIEPSYSKKSSSEFEEPRYDETFTDEEFRLETSDESVERPEERTQRRTHSKKHYESFKSSEGVEGRLNIRVKTIGGPRQHNGEMLVKGSCDEDLKMCRFELNCKRSPLLERETRDWTLKMNGEIVLPESPKTLKDLQEMRHKEIESKIQCQWGSEEKNEVTLRLQKTQSVEMSRLVKNAEFESKKGGLEQYEMLREASKLNKYNVLIEKDLSKQNELYIRRFLDIIKANFFFGGSVEPIRHEARRIKIEATIEPEDCRRVNFTIECNGEKLIVKEAYSPIRIPLYSIASRRPSLRSIGQRSSWTSVFMPTSECEVRSNKVDTFDGLVYKTPITTCYSVLAKDCSEQPEYAIMMKKVEKRGEEKKIKIVTPERKIECELKGERLVVKIDNREERDEEILREMGIEMLSESSCEITLPKLIVRFDGYKTEIKADKRTENTQCGLCGHFDGRRDNEFRRADNEETEDIEEFHRSWMSMDNECEVEEDKIKEKRNYGVESDEEERFDSRERSWSPFDSEEEMMESRSKKMLKKSLKKNVKNVDEEENTYKPEEKHIMIERESKTCFSMKKMPTCQPGDETYETKNKEIEFGCVPRSDRETRRIINALKRGENVNEEIINMSKTSKRITESLEVPTLCRVY